MVDNNLKKKYICKNFKLTYVFELTMYDLFPLDQIFRTDSIRDILWGKCLFHKINILQNLSKTISRKLFRKIIL